MQANDMLGMPLEQALEALRQQGLEMRVTITQAPRTTRSDGTLRVIRIRGNELVAAMFFDGDPVQRQTGADSEPVRRA